MNSEEGALPGAPPALPRLYKKTPLFQAFQSARYGRQALIRDINDRVGTTLICYIAGLAAPIDRDDPAAFYDLLHNLGRGDDVDFLLHTGGGDIDAAEKLIVMLRQKVGTGKLRIIVPDFAKSAGTLIALGADEIVMSDTSELGPIDPQIIRVDKDGNRIQHSVQDYLDAYDQFKVALDKNADDITAHLMMQKLDPATVRHYENVKNRARSIAETLLKEGMLKEKGNWSLAAGILIDTKEWPSHAQMISRELAANKIGLNVDYRSPDDEAWSMYWQLYCLQKMEITGNQKLFESDCVSLSIAT